MDVEVLSKLRQATLHAFLTSNLIGDSLLVRMRSASIGIVGMVAAMGLALVVVVSQQGWPDVGSGPLPQPPHLVQNDPIVAPPAVSKPAQGQVQSPPSSQPVAPSGEARIAGHRTRTAVERVGEPVAVGQPQGGGAGHPTRPTQPPPTASSPPAVAQAPPVESVPTKTPAAPASPQRSAASPGHSPEAPDHSAESHGHGHSSEAPGRSGESHGRSAEAPGHLEGSHGHGHSGEAPGRSGEALGRSGESHGHGHSAEAPGHSGESHGGRH